MQNWNKFPRFVLILILVTGLLTGLVGIRVPVRAAPNFVPSTTIVISQVYGGGGNAGATYTNDFVELFNLSTTNTVSLNGWSIQYATAAGITWQATPLTNVSLAPGQYYLVQLASGGSVGSALPTPDATGTTNMAATAGKVALVNTTVALTGSGCPFVGSVVDFVGYGTTADCFEGAGRAPSPSNINADIRIDSGCTDTDNNNTDFILGTPNPRNTSSPANICPPPTPTPTNTNTPTNTSTPSQTFTPSNTPIFSLTPSLTPAPGQVIISEVAWAGTQASPDDEWIELYNTRPWSIDLTGWRLVNINGTVDILLNGTIPANGFFLLERGSNQTVSNVFANQIYTGALADTNDLLRLRKLDGTIIDTANSNSGAWPAGGGANAASMERYLSGSTASTDNDFGWLTGIAGSGSDAAGNSIYGTPGGGNWAFTVTPTFTPIVTATSTPAGIRSVIINEIAWAGTASGLADDEWIELYNTTNAAINITGWKITAADGTPNITLNGIIPAGGYFLLERGSNLSDDTTVSDIPADQIYTGNALSNTGEALTLYDGSNKVIDTANGNGGAWPAGSASTYGTMERILGTADSDSAWVTNTGVKRNGLNANGGNILGTPKNSNTVGPTPTPTSNRTSTPTIASTFPIDPRPIINEILARPGFDWNQDGRVDVFDEFIEIKNMSPIDISLQGWKLDKLNSTSFSLPNVTLRPNERIVFYSLETNLLLSDGGETIRLINPSGRIYDAYTYTLAKEADKSFCRLPDGNVFGNWFDDCIPTPNLTNTREGKVPTSPDGNESPICDLPDTIPADFFFAECSGYGANIWNPLYWDQLIRNFIQSNTTKWESFIE